MRRGLKNVEVMRPNVVLLMLKRVVLLLSFPT